MSPRCPQDGPTMVPRGLQIIPRGAQTERERAGERERERDNENEREVETAGERARETARARDTHQRGLLLVFGSVSA